jgi:hypothetical protein
VFKTSVRKGGHIFSKHSDEHRLAKVFAVGAKKAKK